jgi:hypothetical protein
VYQPLSLLSMIFIAVVGLMYVYMYMKMIILFGSDVTVDSSVESVMMHSLNISFSTCVLTFS